ncbi:MAG: Hsp20/alpha crystallin family protein [Peptococcia bacterium]
MIYLSLIPWQAFGDFDNIGRGIDSFLENTPFSIFNRGNSPRVDVYQTEQEVIVKAEIPGVSKEDLHVYIDENSLRLSGQMKRDEQYKDEHIYRTERVYGSFSRVIPFPVEVKSEQAKAEYREGILTISVPKVEPTKLKGRRIDIQ